MSERRFERSPTFKGRLIVIAAIISIAFILVGLIVWASLNNGPLADSVTIGEPVLTLPGVDVYEFNTPGQMHCVLAALQSRDSRFGTDAVTLSCIKLSVLKVDPRRWEKALPTPDQGT